MTKMELHDVLRKVLSNDEPDVLRELMKVFLEALMGAEADSACGAAYGERSDERVNSRNGYRDRDFDSRVGTIDLAVPKLRRGTYFPDWLLENRRRAERALTAVIAECYVKGVSTRRVDGIVKALGIEGISSSQVSRMAKSLDAEVEAFRSRPLDGDSYPRDLHTPRPGAPALVLANLGRRTHCPKVSTARCRPRGPRCGTRPRPERTRKGRAARRSNLTRWIDSRETA